MAQVRVEVGGRSYPLACKDGEEDLLKALARQVNAKTEQLAGQLGHLPETRQLLMAAIMLADDYSELASGKSQPANPSDDRAKDAILRATQKVEAAAAALEKAAQAT